jgi:signal transduction histidine kinase
LRQSQEQLLQASKLESIGRLAGGIAHDFNNLLTAISGYSELVLLRLEDDHPVQGDVQEILKATDRAAQLTQQLLAFSRRQMLQPKVLNLNTIVTEISRLLERVIGENIELITALEPDLKSVMADPGQFEQVILNLTVNARDAMPGGGKLLIETANVDLDEEYSEYKKFYIKPGSYVRLSVSDTGVGMDAATQSHIFEPFFTTKDTGLGLATVYGIVKQSDGYIWLYSEPGVGTSFKIYLPAIETKANVVSPVEPATPTEFRGTETVLLVEDEEMVRNLVNRALTENGYTVLVASNGSEALELLENYREQVDLVLTDVIMPKMGGRTLIEKLART